MIIERLEVIISTEVVGPPLRKITVTTYVNGAKHSYMDYLPHDDILSTLDILLEEAGKAIKGLVLERRQKEKDPG